MWKPDSVLFVTLSATSERLEIVCIEETSLRYGFQDVLLASDSSVIYIKHLLTRERKHIFVEHLHAIIFSILSDCQGSCQKDSVELMPRQVYAVIQANVWAPCCLDCYPYLLSLFMV